MNTSEISTNTSQGNSENAEVTAFLDGAFGEEVALEGGNSINDGSSNNPTFEIDPRFKDLDKSEGLIRTYQSKYDSITAEHTKLLNEHEKARKAVEFLNTLPEDENLLYAFINEVKPGLIKPKDVSVALKEALSKEFGEGFKPELSREEADREDPGGTDWRYYRKLDELYQDISKGKSGTNVNSIKEILAEREAQRKLQDAEYQSEIETAKTKFKMSDEEVKNTVEFGSKLKFADLVRITRLLQKIPNAKIGSVENLSGSVTSQSTNRQNFLKNIYG
jgi:hypothetical protein